VDQRYLIRKAKITVDFALIDLKKGGRLVSKELTEDFSSGKIVIEENQKLPSESEITRILAREVVNKLFNEIAPKNIFVKKAIEKGTALIDSGAVYARAGSWKKAKEFWNDAQKNQPTDGRAYYNLGIASEAMGEYDLAASYYKKATLLSPKKKLYQKAIEDLRKIGQSK
jgi:tetratricopeptide (TPR) repeat protein